MNKIKFVLFSAGISLALAFTFGCSSSNDGSGNGNENNGGSSPIKKDKISGFAQKGPFIKGSAITLYELDDKFTQTGRSFKEIIKDDKGSFEIKNIELVSSYAMLEADGFYRNEVTGEMSKAPIKLYAIADIKKKSNMNVNLLTHLEYYRVLKLVEEGKNLEDAKKLAQREILAVFGISGAFGNSEDMSIFGTTDGDAALLAISILLQGELSEGQFVERLTDFRIGFENTGTWNNEAIKDEMVELASTGNIESIRNNILGWNLSSTVPDIEKFLKNYWYAYIGLGTCTTSLQDSIKSSNDGEYYICKDNDWLAWSDINWNGDNGGTLELVNGSNKDIVLFVGQVPSKSSMLGGVRAGATVRLDISKHVSDFAVGGYTILRGVTKEEYDKYDVPSNAKLEFTAMVTYGAGKMYRYNINPNYMGDNGFRVSNRSRIGVELRKDSPNGEKVAYLPALIVNQMISTQTTDVLTLFPVYVFYDKTTGEVSTLKSTSMFDAVMVAPRPLGPNSTNIPNNYFPSDETFTWDYIKSTLKQAFAYVKVVNNIPNQFGYITNAGSIRFISQNGYDGIGSGESLVFEVESTDEGTEINLVAEFRGGMIRIPVLFESETTPPVIKNGYNYTVTVNFLGGDTQDAANYKATIMEGNKRNISNQLESL